MRYPFLNLEYQYQLELKHVVYARRKDPIPSDSVTVVPTVVPTVYACDLGSALVRLLLLFTHYPGLYD
jgi:hypothetical protein